MQYYALTELADDNEKNQFYSRLNAVYGSTPPGDIVIIIGHLNAKVGVGNSGVQYDVGRHSVDVRNDHGGRFVDFCSTHNLIIGGTTFQHRKCDKVSWQHPSGRYAIDHLAISRRFRGCLKDIRNRKLANIGNLRDHYLIVAMLRLRTAAIKQPDELYRRAPIYFTRDTLETTRSQI